MKSLINKTESMIQRVRWKVFFAEKEDQNEQPDTNYYGFRTPNSAPKSNSLIGFENDVINLISNIEFKELPYAQNCGLVLA